MVRVRVFLADIADFAAVKEVYARHFPPPRPARTTPAGRDIPAGLLVEIECVAAVPDA